MMFRTSMSSVVAVMLAACGDSGSTSESAATLTGTSTTEADTTTTTGPWTDTTAPTGTDTTAQSGTDSDSGSSTTTPDASTTASESSSGTTAPVDETTTTGDPDTTGTAGTTDDETTGEPPPPQLPSLWYSVEQSLIHIELDPVDGTVVGLVNNQIVSDAPLTSGFNGLTVLDGGALLGSRLEGDGTQIYLVQDPPTTPDTPAEATVLGQLLDEGGDPVQIEALYTDCLGRVYLMDTGTDPTLAVGNRLMRFTGDYLAGDFAFEVITDLEKASIGDIDDMSPGIVMGTVNDKVGYAIDSGALWQLDYTTGTGMMLAQTEGRFGVHALGGTLFDDEVPRLYVLSGGTMMLGPDLLEVNLVDNTVSDPLITGPVFGLDFNGFSGLAGPLTDCVTSLPR